MLTVIAITIAKEFHFFIGSDMVEEDRSERLCDVYPNSETYLYFWTELRISLCEDFHIEHNKIILLTNIKTKQTIKKVK
jgi:hypothetical protein